MGVLRRLLDVVAGRDPEVEDVRRCHEKFGILVRREPTVLTHKRLQERVAFIQEELDELAEAVANDDLPEILDALLDIVYVAKGTAVMIGIGKAWPDGWDEVQQANLAKVRGVGKRGHAVDLVKPPGWTSPNHFAVLRRHFKWDFRKWYSRCIHGPRLEDDGVNP